VDYLFDPLFWRSVGVIIWIDLLLAGDNAVVISLAVRSLPKRQQWWGRILGTLGAVVLRLIFLWIVSFLLRVPLVKLVGGLVLVWIAIKLVRPGAEGHGETRAGASLLEAVWVIMVADVFMSLDNVIAVAGAANDDFRLLLFGVGVSIPLVVFGSALISALIDRFAWVVWLGGGILGWVAGEMITTDPWVVSTLGPVVGALHQPVKAVLFFALTGLGWWLARRSRVQREYHRAA
jgi:YjbE family integral membrane protein